MNETPWRISWIQIHSSTVWKQSKFPLILRKNQHSKQSSPSLLVQGIRSLATKWRGGGSSFQLSGTLVSPGRSIHPLRIRLLSQQSSKLQQREVKLFQAYGGESLPSLPPGLCIGLEEKCTMFWSLRSQHILYFYRIGLSPMKSFYPTSAMPESSVDHSSISQDQLLWMTEYMVEQ